MCTIDAPSPGRYWLHRISHEWDISYRLLDQGYLSTGWAGLAGSGIEDIPAGPDGWEKFEAMLQSTPYSKKRSRYCLWNFLSFAPGDWVVVPLFNKEFSVYRVERRPLPVTRLTLPENLVSKVQARIGRSGDGLLQRTETGTPVDLGFAVPVTAIRAHLSRYGYADGPLTARMKLRQTNADISDLAESVRQAVETKAPLDLYATAAERLSEGLLSAIRSQLSPDKFEGLIAWYFEKLGASRVLRPGKNAADKGEGADADIVAEFEALGIVFYVQAKFHKSGTDTSQWAVEQITAYRDLHEPSGEYTVIPWVVSTADGFSEDAQAKAEESGVRLIDGETFGRMLMDVGLSGLDRAFESSSPPMAGEK